MTVSSIEKDRLVEECQGLVRHLAQQVRKRMPSWVEMDDLVGYGQVGLMQAARDFDPQRGNKFSTFAFYRIRGAIYEGVNKLMWFRAARSPESKYGPMADDLLETAAGDQAAGEGAKADLATEASWLGRMTASLAMIYLASAGNEGKPLDVVDAQGDQPWQDMSDNESKSKLAKALDHLPPDAAALMRAVYYEDRTLQEAADRLGISKSWASRMHAKALEQLAQRLGSHEHRGSAA
ncbi:MAG TPA: sigma-70 family RNA polymerase sigma factor [Caulifigura sp.]|jgi:RNA polymerase sigma factor for flagellar operon FliA|nr:sigma-70 family RNA polymerase sigma factor [Caulifigura sp.]